MNNLRWTSRLTRRPADYPSDHEGWDRLMCGIARAAERNPRARPVMPRAKLEDDVADVVAALEGATAPLARAVRERLARHVR